MGLAAGGTGVSAGGAGVFVGGTADAVAGGWAVEQPTQKARIHTAEMMNIVDFIFPPGAANRMKSINMKKLIELRLAYTGMYKKYQVLTLLVHCSSSSKQRFFIKKRDIRWHRFIFSRRV